MAPKILLLQLRQLGDILLTTPCIREIKRAWPEAEVSFLAHPMGRLVLEGNPYLHELIIYGSSWTEQAALLKKLRRASYDIVLDFMYNPRSAFYARWTGASRRLAFPSRRDFLFTESVAQNPEVEYIVREKFRYLEQLSISPVAQGLDLPWSAQHAALSEKWLQSEPALAVAPLRVVLSPTHRRVERQWPLSRYAALADRLTRTWGAAVLWIWGPGEQEFVQRAMCMAKEKTYLAPATSFRELAALIANCDLFVGNSNGPSHVAVAVDTPSLQLHGPTYAKTWCPLSERHGALQAGQSSEQKRGPIDLISEEELWQALNGMRSVAEASAQGRQLVGVKKTWKKLLSSGQGGIE